MVNFFSVPLCHKGHFDIQFNLVCGDVCVLNFCRWSLPFLLQNWGLFLTAGIASLVTVGQKNRALRQAVFKLEKGVSFLLVFPGIHSHYLLENYSAISSLITLSHSPWRSYFIVGTPEVFTVIFRKRAMDTSLLWASPKIYCRNQWKHGAGTQKHVEELTQQVAGSTENTLRRPQKPRTNYDNRI